MEDVSFEQRLSRSTFIDNEPTPSTVFNSIQRYENFKATSVSLGLLWNIAGTWSFGLRYDSSFTADVDFTLKEFGSDIPDPFVFPQDRKLKFPSTLAFGISRRFGDRLTTAFDMSFTDWNDFFVSFDDEGTLRRVSLIDGSDIDDPDTRTDFDRTLTVRLGMEYVFIPKAMGDELPNLWSVRAGLFYDQEPASGRSSAQPDAPGTGDPDDFYGFTVGFGLLTHERFNFDFAYQLRYGNDVNRDFVRGPAGFDFSEDVLQHRLILSTVIYF